MPSVTLPPDCRLLALDATDSTNEEAKRLARAGAPDKTVVWARSQTGGKGRAGRAWVSPPGNLYVSLILRPEVPAMQAAELGFVAALALVQALDELAPGLDLAFKWPNDVLLAGRKLAGILIETESQAALGIDRGPDWLVLGIGVNVASAPAGTEFPATSLAGECAATVTVEGLLSAFVGSFLDWMTAWRLRGFAALRAPWLARAWGGGQVITVRLPKATLRGTFVDLDADGALILGLDSGERRRITAGDVFFG